MAKSKIEILIEGQDKLSKHLKSVEGNSKNLVKTFKKSAVEINAKIELIRKALIGLQKAFQLVERGAKFKQQQDAFNELSRSVGADAQELIRNMREMSGETLSTSEIMVNASRAMALGLESSRLPELMEISRAAARAFGQDVSFMFDSIVLGIGRQSKLILDNLGIIISAKDTYESYAKVLGKSTSELTEAERKQAFMNEAIRQGQDLVEKINLSNRSQLENIQRLKSGWKDFVDQLGVFLNESPRVKKIIDVLANSMDFLANKMSDMATGRVGELQDQLKKADEQIELMNRRMGPFARFFHDSEDTARRLNEAMEAKKQILSELNDLQDTNKQLTEEEKENVEETIQLLQLKEEEMQRIFDLSVASLDVDRAKFDVAREGYESLLTSFLEIQRSAIFSTTELLSKTIDKTHKGMSTALSSIILGTKNAKEAFQDFGKALVKTVIDYVTEWLVANTIMLTMSKFVKRFVATTAAELANAWAPAAALASLATLGGNAAPANAALIGTLGTALGVASVASIKPEDRALGGDEIVTKPTLFLAGESGPERATFSPLGRGQSNRFSDIGGGINIIIQNANLSSDRDISDTAEMLGREFENATRTGRSV